MNTKAFRALRDRALAPRYVVSTTHRGGNYHARTVCGRREAVEAVRRAAMEVVKGMAHDDSALGFAERLVRDAGANGNAVITRTFSGEPFGRGANASSCLSGAISVERIAPPNSHA